MSHAQRIWPVVKLKKARSGYLQCAELSTWRAISGQLSKRDLPIVSMQNRTTTDDYFREVMQAKPAYRLRHRVLTSTLRGTTYAFEAPNTNCHLRRT